jgi:hypothetical protein
LNGKSASVLKALALEPAPVNADWIAYTAWKRKSHLDEKKKLVRKLLRELLRDKLVERAHCLHKEFEKGMGRVVEKDDCLGWQITAAGRQLMEIE